MSLDLPREEPELELELEDPLELLEDELEELDRPLRRRSGERPAALPRSGLLLRVAALDFFAGDESELELELLLRPAILINSGFTFSRTINKRENKQQQLIEIYGTMRELEFYERLTNFKT